MKSVSDFNLDKYKPTKHNVFHEVVQEVADFMGESHLLGKWKKKCKGIPHAKLTAWMIYAESTQNDKFPKQKIFNMEKKKFKKQHE